MNYPRHELLDRISILIVRSQKTAQAVSYELGANKFDLEMRWVKDLIRINSDIWALESDIREGKENKLGLVEVGRRALAIRALNAKRIAIKNEIANFYGECPEHKVDHASAEPQEDP